MSIPCDFQVILNLLNSRSFINLFDEDVVVRLQSRFQNAETKKREILMKGESVIVKLLFCDMSMPPSVLIK